MTHKKPNHSSKPSGNVVAIGEGASVRSVNISQGNGTIQAGRDVSIGYLPTPKEAESIDDKYESSPDLFISYISPEKALAVVLKDWIMATFSRRYKTFVASDYESIRLGDNWLQKIEQAIRSSRVMIVLLSPSSLSRPWINFEAGGAWMRGTRVLCICHSGQKKADLPAPYSHLQAVELENNEFGKLFFETLAEELGEKILPHIDYVDMQKDLINATY